MTRIADVCGHEAPANQVIQNIRPGRPARGRATDIVAFAAQIVSGMLRLAPTELLAGQRQTLGGRLFHGSALFVQLVAGALQGRPDLYPDSPIDGAQLALRQRRADAWRMACGQLEDLLRLAQDSYIQEQAAAIDDGMALLALVRTSASLPPQSLRPGMPDAHDRLLWLQPAQDILDDRQQRKLRAQRPPSGSRGALRIRHPGHPRSHPRAEAPRGGGPARGTAHRPARSAGAHLTQSGAKADRRDRRWIRTEGAIA